MEHATLSPTLWLPTTRKEALRRGWEELDVVLFSGDAYVDHPSFGVAVVGRLIEAEGLRVAIVPQPDWHGDFRDFTKMGRPRLFFGISPGCMDSMVNKYTANRRLRSADAYSPNGRHDMRPEYPTLVYTRILKRLFPDVPVVLGGIEASLRRLTHYDYWQDCLKPSVLLESGADLLLYGMGEKNLPALCRLLAALPGDAPLDAATFRRTLLACPIPQTAIACHEPDIPGGIRPDDLVLHSHEACLRDKRCQAENFRHIEEESNRWHAQRLLQRTGNRYVVVEPPFPPLTTQELDRAFDLPYTRLPHPKYEGKVIPAYEMIRHSITMHRGCFGGCAFCTISAHQGKFISSRSQRSILREAEAITRMPDFKGYISDLGGPSANMYAMRGKDLNRCQHCKRPSCLHPAICPNLDTDHGPLLAIYQAVDRLPGVRKSFVGSGIRYDLMLHPTGDERVDEHNRLFTTELIAHHVSGRLKVAPEHTEEHVLALMRKPSFTLFHEFRHVFEDVNRRLGLHQQLIPYFISSHPGCRAEDMAALAVQTKRLNFQLEQVQDFTPTPMTVSTEAFYTGLHPYTLKPVFTAKTQQEKLAQRQFFFWYKPEERAHIMSELRRMGREDLVSALFPGRTPGGGGRRGRRR